jgi:hypothetical protein
MIANHATLQITATKVSQEFSSSTHKKQKQLPQWFFWYWISMICLVLNFRDFAILGKMYNFSVKCVFPAKNANFEKLKKN